jgi:hypothetical protein
MSPRDIGQRLFSIDVEAEVRKLVGGRHKVAGEPTCELVRSLIAWGATGINLTVRRRTLRIVGRRVRTEDEMYRLLATIMSPSESTERRHGALTALEQRYGLGILAAFSEEARSVVLEWSDGARSRGLELVRGREPRRYTPRDPGFRILVRGKRRVSREVAYVKERCKYARIPIRLDGEGINRGMRLEGCLVQVDIRNSRLIGAVGLPHVGDISRLIRVRSGVVHEDLVFSSWEGMAIEAVVQEEDDDLPATRGTVGRAGRRLYERLSELYDGLNEPARRRALELLFERYRSVRDDALFDGVPAFRRCRGAPLQLGQLRARARMGKIYGLGEKERVACFDTRGRLVLRLSDQERRFLERDAGVPIASPPRRSRRHGLRFAARLDVLLWSIARRLLSRPGSPLEEEDLDPDELRLVEAVRDELRSGGFRMPEDARPFTTSVVVSDRQRAAWVRIEHIDGAVEYRIGRRHPTVRAAVVALDRSRAYLVPAMIAITGGVDGYSADRESVARNALEQLKDL